MVGSEFQEEKQSQQLRLLSDEDSPKSYADQEPRLSQRDDPIEHNDNKEPPGSPSVVQDSSDYTPDNTRTVNSELVGGLDNYSTLVDQTLQRSKGHELLEWKKELLFSFFIIAFLVCIVVTIYPFHGKPRPEWPFNISINALLSIYAVAFKAALIPVVISFIIQGQWNWFAVERPLYDLVRYDKAGRGTLGALSWLWWNKLRQPVASLGVVIFITAIAIDPFIQQLVQYVNCTVTLAQDTESATIPRTSFFNPVTFHEGAGGDSAPSPAEETPVLSGIFSPPTDVNFNCLTGNCTFALEYGTVGYCSYCEDISSTITFTGNCSSEACNSTLPSGLSLTSISGSGQHDVQLNVLAMGPTGSGGSVLDSPPFEILVGQTVYSQGMTDPTTGDIIPGCEDPTASSTWKCRGYGAASCTFSPCVRTYKASVMANRLNESMVDFSDPRLSWGFPNNITANSRGESFIRGMIDTQCISSEEKNNLTSLGYLIGPQSRWLPYNLTFGSNFNVSQPVPLDAPFPQSLLVHKCLYMINDSFTIGLFSYFLRSLFNGIVTGQATKTVTVEFKGPKVPLYIYNFSHNDFDTINSVFSNAASVLSAHIRENGEEIYSDPALGVVSYSSICIQINWAWLSLPAVLAGLTLVLLGLSIKATRKQRAPILKSSLSAVIFHGPCAAQWHNNSKSDLPSQPINDCSLNILSDIENSTKHLTIALDRSEPAICLREIGATH
jgi:hypothetical protein